jgi:hypothetical protein
MNRTRQEGLGWNKNRSDSDLELSPQVKWLPVASLDEVLTGVKREVGRVDPKNLIFFVFTPGVSMIAVPRENFI